MHIPKLLLKAMKQPKIKTIKENLGLRGIISSLMKP